jgi:arabinose-5-phosphate isomerase
VDYTEIAKRVLRIESEAVKRLIGRVDDSFNQAVETIYGCSGRVIITGMGKSGNIANKIAATFRSTGTPAGFLHPAEAIHGDLGMFAGGDVLVAISNSGGQKELTLMVPYVKRLGGKVLTLTGNTASDLARLSDVVLDVSVEEEACPLGLAPTASTTACLAMGDALAVALLEKRGFTRNDFACLHPSGTLGRRLLIRVSHLMHTGDEIPVVHKNQVMREIILEMTSKKLGATTVVDGHGKLTGIFTDGDLRRLVEHSLDFLDTSVSETMAGNPKRIDSDCLAEEALQMMESWKVTCLPVVDDEERVIGIIHLHDILQAKIR